MDQPPEQQKTADYRGEGEYITDPVQITALLKRVKDSRTLLQITLPGQPVQYNSALLDINPDHTYLLLDELTPAEGHKAIRQQGKITASIRLLGVDMRFSSIVEEIGGQAGIAFYRVAFPKSLYYRQRRSYYRVKIGMGLSVPFNISRESGTPYQGRLEDISLGGIGVELKQQIPFHSGDLLPACAIELPSGDKIECQLEIRYLSSDERHKRFHLGARFVKLDHAREHAVQRFVSEAERDALRRKSKK